MEEDSEDTKDTDCQTLEIVSPLSASKLFSLTKKSCLEYFIFRIW